MTASALQLPHHEQNDQDHDEQSARAVGVVSAAKGKDQENDQNNSKSADSPSARCESAGGIWKPKIQKPKLINQEVGEDILDRQNCRATASVAGHARTRLHAPQRSLSESPAIFISERSNPVLSG